MTSIYVYILLTKCEVKMAGFWPSSLFCIKFFMDLYPAISSHLDQTTVAWSRKDLLYGSRNTEKNLRTYLFLSIEREARKPVLCKSNGGFCFFFVF